MNSWISGADRFHSTAARHPDSDPVIGVEVGESGRGEGTPHSVVADWPPGCAHHHVVLSSQGQLSYHLFRRVFINGVIN